MCHQNSPVCRQKNLKSNIKWLPLAAYCCQFRTLQNLVCHQKKIWVERCRSLKKVENHCTSWHHAGTLWPALLERGSKLLPSIRNQVRKLALRLALFRKVSGWVSKIFAAIRFVNAYGTKNPYQSSWSLWQRENWKPVQILGRAINSKIVGSPTQAKLYGAPSTCSWASQNGNQFFTISSFQDGTSREKSVLQPRRLLRVTHRVPVQDDNDWRVMNAGKKGCCCFIELEEIKMVLNGIAENG